MDPVVGKNEKHHQAFSKTNEQSLMSNDDDQISQITSRFGNRIYKNIFQNQNISKKD